jgi:two-component system, OmpR family, phosphate regulon sensor histidine kinase PhoR
MKRKILTSYILILLVGTLTTGILSFSFVRNSYFQNKEDRLVSYGELITDSLVLEGETGDLRNFFWLTQKFAQRTRVRVTLLDAEGNVMADSADNSIVFINQKAQPEIQAALRGEVRGIQRMDETTSVTSMFLALPPIEVHNEKLIIRLSDPIESYMHESVVFLRYIMISIVLGLLIAMTVGMWNIGKITRPIIELTSAAKDLAAAKFSTRINIRTRDELEELAQTFNHMSERLEENILQLQKKNIQMDAMLSGMTDGMLAVATDGQILMVNQEMTNLLHDFLEFTEGENIESYQSMLPELYDFIQETILQKKVGKSEFALEKETGKMCLVAKSSLMRDPDNPDEVMGVFLLIQDVTAIRKLENLRNDFVANVTHELRTPLTLISGFVETLQHAEDLEDEERHKALSIIELEAERLKRLINDVLTLSEIENIQIGKTRRRFNAVKEIKEVVHWIKPLAEKKDIGLSEQYESQQTLLDTNPGWFRQMLSNLLENAVKYTPPGGRVSVTARSDSNHFLMMIQDNGMGIPDHEKGLIFQRFYRINQDAGKDTKGTGLGLTIVRHIVTEMGGTITVTTPEGGGSLFKVIIPLMDMENRDDYS